MSSSDDDLPLGARKATAATKQALKKDTGTANGAAPEGGASNNVESDEEDVPLRKRVKGSVKKAGPAPKGKAVKQDEATEDPTSQDEGPKKKAAPKKRATKKAEDGAAADKPKREKKEYDMPGQTRDTPPETDPLRKFYTSLLEQRPDSDMAKKWCCTHGLLELEEAEAYVKENKLGRGGSGVAKSPARASPARRAPAKPKAAGGAKKKVEPPAKRPRARGIKYEDMDSEEEQEASEDAEDKPLAKRKKVAAPASNGKATAGKPPAGARRGKGKDVAFLDGGLDESDDDMPLTFRKPAAAAKPAGPSTAKPSATPTETKGSEPALTDAQNGPQSDKPAAGSVAAPADQPSEKQAASTAAAAAAAPPVSTGAQPAAPAAGGGVEGASQPPAQEQSAPPPPAAAAPAAGLPPTAPADESDEDMPLTFHRKAS